LGSAFNQLVNWAENVLPDLIMDPIRQLVEILIDALDLIPIFGPIAGNVLEYFANIFGLLADKSQAAQDAADQAQEDADAAQGTANARFADAAVTLATSESTGTLIVDNFNGAANSGANGLGSNWTQNYSSGSGTMGLDGNGNLRWYQSGAQSRTGKARYSETSLTTDVQKAQIVVNGKMGDFFVPPIIWILLRMDSSGDNYVSASIYHSACEIGYTVSGNYTRLGSSVSVTHAAGDTWAFCAGTSAGDYEFKLFQNGNERVARTDSTPSSLKGASYRYSGLRVRAGAAAVGFWTEQRAHPPMGVFTAIDYTP